VAVLLRDKFEPLDGFVGSTDLQASHSAKIERLVALGMMLKILFKELSSCQEVSLSIVGMLGFLEDCVCGWGGIEEVVRFVEFGFVLRRKHEGFVFSMGFEIH
jgi:hypothetical protein